MTLATHHNNNDNDDAAAAMTEATDSGATKTKFDRQQKRPKQAEEMILRTCPRIAFLWY